MSVCCRHLKLKNVQSLKLFKCFKNNLYQITCNCDWNYLSHNNEFATVCSNLIIMQCYKICVCWTWNRLHHWSKVYGQFIEFWYSYCIETSLWKSGYWFMASSTETLSGVFTAQPSALWLNIKMAKINQCQFDQTTVNDKLCYHQNREASKVMRFYSLHMLRLRTWRKPNNEVYWRLIYLNLNCHWRSMEYVSSFAY